MKWQTVVSLLFLMLVAACDRLPVGSGPAGPSVSRTAFTKPWTTRPVLFVGLGDSITAGYGTGPGYSYFDRLALNPVDEFSDMRGLSLAAVMPNLQIKNLAVSGSTSLQLLTYQLPRLALQPTNILGLVVITTGGNDIIHDYGRDTPREGAMFGASLEQAQPWISNFAQRVEVILDRVTDRFPGGCHILIANIYDPSDETGRIETPTVSLPDWPGGLRVLLAYNEAIASAATRRANVHLVDVHGAFLGHGMACVDSRGKHYRRDDPHYWYFENVEDPNERGYDALRRLFLREIVKVFSTPEIGR